MIRFGFGRKRKEQNETQALEGLRTALGSRTLVMVGLMGCGKSAVGRRLAAKLALPFVDADEEIEKAAGKSINDIFSEHGEAHFRERECKVIARLLGQGPQVLATGGGAFINPETRANISSHGISIWLKAELPVLMKRVGKRDTRPLLKTGDPEATMRKLIEVRYPIYAEANLIVESRDVAHEVMVNDVIQALRICPALAQGRAV